MSGPLAGVRVLDLTRLLPGNFATLLLSGLGADVIKVEERNGGDGIRHMYVPGGRSESGAHVVLNRGKKSIAIDLKTDEGREALLELVKGAQVLIDSFRPGVLDRLGLSDAALRAVNPVIVRVSINAFGATGPYTAIPAHDLNSVGYAGGLGLVQDAEGNLVMPGIQNADMAAGLHAALAVVSGLRVADKQSQPFSADVAMTDAAASLLALQVATHLSTGESPPVPDLLTGRLACYRMYQCGDGKWVTVGGLEPKFFGRMVELMGLPELAGQQYLPHAEGQEQVAAALAAKFAERPREQWLQVLGGEDTCVGPVLDIGEALAEPHFAARGAVTTAAFSDGSTAAVFASIPWTSDPDADLGAPGLGEHTDSVLADAGLDADFIADLRKRGVVGPA